MEDTGVVALDPLNVIENNENENCIIVDEGNANQTAFSSLLNKKSDVENLIEKRRWRKKEENLINCKFNESRSNLYLPKSPLDSFLYLFNDRRRRRRRHRLKGIHSRPDTNRTGAEGLSFYYPRLLHCLDQMLAVMLLSQHRVSSSKTVRPRAPCGARCMGHAVSTWSAVCSEAPHSQFGEGARPHLCMDEWNRPTPVRRRLSLTQAARGKPIPTGLILVPGTKARSLEAFSQYSAFHL